MEKRKGIGGYKVSVCQMIILRVSICYGFNCVPPKRYVEVPISGISECELIWEWDHFRCHKLR